MAPDFEPIYDSASDDQAFEQLARTIARRNGAHAAVLHWRSRDEPYDHEVAVLDDVASVVPPCASEDPLIATGDHPAPEDAGGYDAFVEWVQALGETSPHCISGLFDQDDLTLAVGLHRGPDQQPFDDGALERLQRMGRPIMDVIGFRARLNAARRDRELLASALDGLGSGVMMVSRAGRLRFANEAARRMIARGDGLILRGERLHPAMAEDVGRFSQTLARIGLAGAPRATSISIQRDGRDPYLLSLNLSDAADGRGIMAVFHDPDHVDTSLVARLRSLFGLGQAEAEIACALSDGHDIEAIAALRATSVGTVRNQLKSITAKMNCCRQSEVVAIIRSLPSLNIVSEMSSTILLEPGFATSRRTTSYDRNRSLRASHGHQKSRTA
jgi:DNA-binding CsgD family transcriptional regulator/PAS domain-containing protein